MYFVIGLGNPGSEYEHTPHNIGKELIRELALLHGYSENDFSSDYKNNRTLSLDINNQAVTLIESASYMNHSGQALASYAIDQPEQVIVIYDDIDLPFGVVKLHKDKGSGGHNGVRSIEQSLKTRSFIRFRVGVCPRDWLGKPRKPKPGRALNTYLTDKKLSKKYRAEYAHIAQTINKSLVNIVTHGYTQAVSQQATNNKV